MDTSTIILLILGILFLIFGLRGQMKIINKKKSGDFKEIIGIIVDFKEFEEYDEESRNTKRTYYPIIEYEVDGTKYTYEAKFGTNFKVGLGKEKKLMYNINNPQDVISPKDKNGLFLAIVGVLMIVAAIVTVINN